MLSLTQPTLTNPQTDVTLGLRWRGCGASAAVDAPSILLLLLLLLLRWTWLVGLDGDG